MIPRYFSLSLFNSKSPLELGLPWISYEAIDFLASFIKPYHQIAEYGSGGSTIFFAKVANSVLSIESDSVRVEKIAEHISNRHLSNVTLKVFPFYPNNREEFRKSSFLKAIEKNFYDVILIDSYDVNHNLRLDCFYFAENFIKPSGCIVVHDSFRYTELRNNNRAKSYKVYYSFGPCRKGITTTDIYFY